MQKYYLRDPRQQSVVNGKAEGGWLRVPPSPALWVARREQAGTFSIEEIHFLKKCEPYLEGCEVVPAENGDAHGPDTRCTTGS